MHTSLFDCNTHLCSKFLLSLVAYILAIKVGPTAAHFMNNNYYTPTLSALMNLMTLSLPFKYYLDFFVSWITNKIKKKLNNKFYLSNKYIWYNFLSLSSLNLGIQFTLKTDLNPSFNLGSSYFDLEFKKKICYESMSP